MVGRRRILGAIGTVLVGTTAGCSGGDGGGSTATGTATATRTATARATDSATPTATPTPTETDTATATETGTPARTPIADRLYAPSAVLELPSAGFATLDVGALYDHLDAFPPWLREDVQAYDDEYDAVSVPAIEQFTAQAYWEGPTPSVGGDQALGGSLLAEGGIDPEGALTTMRSIVGDTGASMDPRGSVAGYDLYTLPLAGGLSPEVGFGDDGVVGGVTANVDAPSRDPLRAALGASDRARDAETSDVGRRLLEPLGNAPAVAGVEGDVAAYLPDAAPLDPIRTGLEGVAAGTEFVDSAAVSVLVAAYGEGSTPTAAEVEDVLGWLGDQGSDGTPELEPTVRDRTVLLGATTDAEAALAFAREGIGPVEFAVLLAGAAFTPAVPWL
jgi:hypothetical protein